jgi:DNA-binding CsgD family transcriptional regulator
MTETTPQGASELVGRDAELERLGAFLIGPSEAGPSALVFEGEPGIGKTTLWREGLRLSRGVGHRILTSRPAEAEASLSFAALADLVGEALDEARGHDLPVPQRRALEVALLRGEPEDQTPDLRAVSVALLGILRSLASAGRVVVAIDDVHWMDPPSARALGFAARRLDEEPVAFLATSLPPAGDHPFDLPAERIDRVPLGPLAPEDLRSLFRARLGTDLPPSTIRQIDELSGGNPFFALEMARAAIRGEPAVTGQSVPIPKNLREDLLRHRYSALPKHARRVVLAASAASRPTVELLSAIGIPDADAGLDEAIQAGVLERGGNEIRFAHPFFRSAVYANEPRDRRHALHRALADVVTDPEERARHLALGSDGPDADVADALEDASLIASDRGAPESAAELAELAARLTPEDQFETSQRRRCDAARHHASLGDHGRAIALLDQVVATTPEGPSRSAASWLLGRMTATAGDLPRAADVLTDALSGPDVPASLTADLHGELALTSWLMGDGDRATRHAELALEAPAGDSREGSPSAWPAEDEGTDLRPALMARCRAIRAAAKGDLASAEAALDEAATGYRATGSDFELARTLLLLGSVRRRRKQKRPAREALTSALEGFERLGNAAWAERATDELSGISGRRPSAGRLTPAERRVARLAAAGRTNREIADVLFMSVRTVEGHLSRIYAKLEIRSRVELALFPETTED